MTNDNTPITLRVPRLRPDWHVDVGIEPTDWPKARLVASFHDPAGDSEARVQVRLHRDGTWWRIPGTDDLIVVPWTEPLCPWGNAKNRPRIVAWIPPLLEQVQQATQSIRSLATEPIAHRTLNAALALALELASGELHHRVVHSARVFESGAEDPDACDWIERLLELRLVLEDLCLRHGEPVLIDALARADLALGPFASAVLLLSDDVYARLTKDFPVDDQAWWGIRQADDRRVPLDRVTDVLRKCGGEQRGSTVVAFPRGYQTHEQHAPTGMWRAAAADRDLATLIRSLGHAADGEVRGRYESVLETLEVTPCPWLRRDLKDAVSELSDRRGVLGWRVDALEEAVSPAPGRVPVLLYLPDRHQGLLLELRISHGDGGLWSLAPRLLPLARDAVREAYAAVSASTDTRQPRHALEEHTLRIVGPPNVLDQLHPIDGSSLALPAAIAFASLWLERAPAHDLAATGGLQMAGSIDVLPVGLSGLQAKSLALASWCQPDPVRLLVAKPPPDLQALPSVNVVPVTGLLEALHQAGVDPRGASPWIPLGNQSDTLAELERLFHDLQTQDIDRHHAPGMNAWSVLGDRIRTLTISLSTALPADDPRLRKAEAYAALAFAHAGEMRDAGQVPEVLEDDLPPGVAAVVLLSSLVRSIGNEHFESCDSLRHQLDAALERLHPAERRSLLGVVRGTQGRSFLHDRRLSRDERVLRSLPLLEEAVSHHARFQPAETARSRIYLAMALRLAQRFDEALQQLDRASRELDEHTRAWSGTYHRTTRTYWLYERARWDLSRGQPEAALDKTSLALELLDEQGFWPAIGILRTRIWAHRVKGERVQAESCLDELHRLLSHVPPATMTLMERIAQEAQGMPKDDGEVY